MSISSQHPNPYAAVRPPYANSRNNFSGSAGTTGGSRIPRLLKRLFKFPQMDFEVAIWEMTTLMFAPKKVFRNVYYRKQTKNTYTSTDPAFPYLLCFFLVLTSLAWSLAYANASPPNILRIAIIFVFIHCLLSSLVIATIMYFFVGKALGPGGLLAGRGPGRRRGLFSMQGEGMEDLEFGFCFEVAIRAFFPLWVFLYVIQFILLPAVTSQRWPSTLLSNTLHLAAFSHSTYVTFLGYNSLPSLSSPQLLLAPLLLYLVLFIVTSAVGWNASRHLAPILWCFGGLRKLIGPV